MDITLQTILRDFNDNFSIVNARFPHQKFSFTVMKDTLGVAAREGALRLIIEEFLEAIPYGHNGNYEYIRSWEGLENAYGLLAINVRNILYCVDADINDIFLEDSQSRMRAVKTIANAMIFFYGIEKISSTLADLLND